MTSTFTFLIRRLPAVAVLASGLAGLAGCATGSDPVDTFAASPSSPAGSAIASGTTGVPVALRFDEHSVAATLADTAASRRLAAMLPVSLELNDAWGQAMAGRLPHSILVGDTRRVLRPTRGGIYYRPDSATLAVYYDDLGQTVPPPGLIPLGMVTARLDEITRAGSHTTVRIEPTRPRS